MGLLDRFFGGEGRWPCSRSRIDVEAGDPAIVMSTMFRAVMIDGFGWFRTGDFRRAWLLFDEVDYVFPAELRGDMWFPPLVRNEPWYQVRQPSTSTGDRADIETWISHDLGSASFRKALSRIPADDIAYAQRIVATDLELCDLLAQFPADDPAPAMSILTSKLLIAARRTKAIPIVGKQYAWTLLAAKFSSQAEIGWDVRSRANTAAFAAGLSLQQIDGDALAQLEFARLDGFKRKHARLLDLHQRRLLEVALAYGGLPAGDEFERSLAMLELQAANERDELDREWAAVWREAGFDVLKSVVSTAVAGAIPAIALVRDASWGLLSAAALASLAASAGAVAASGVQVVRGLRKPGNTGMAYLFEANELVARHSG
jgi:hypothetical protein